MHPTILEDIPLHSVHAILCCDISLGVEEQGTASEAAGSSTAAGATKDLLRQTLKA